MKNFRIERLKQIAVCLVLFSITPIVFGEPCADYSTRTYNATSSCLCNAANGIPISASSSTDNEYSSHINWFSGLCVDDHDSECKQPLFSSFLYDGILYFRNTSEDNDYYSCYFDASYNKMSEAKKYMPRDEVQQ